MKQELVPYIHTDSKKWDHYYLDPTSGIIYFSKRHNGRRIKFSCKTPNGIQAKRFANREFDRRIGKAKTHVRSLLGEELDLYLKVKEAENLDRDTMYNIRRGAGEIRQYWGDKFPNEITADNLALWYSWWAINKKVQMENAVKYMRNFCSYLSQKVVNGYPLLPAVPRIVDPNYKKHRAARKKKKENIFSAKDFKSIYVAASSLEERVLALMMYTMATRIGETLSMRFGSEILLDTNPPLYRWRMGQNKADLEGRHALHPILITPLLKLRTKRMLESTSLLFPQKTNNQKPLRPQMIEWAQWEKRSNVKFHWTAHTFRHTCLSNLFNDPKNPHLLICKLYRISLKEAEETYVKPTEDGIEHMRSTLKVEL